MAISNLGVFLLRGNPSIPGRQGLKTQSYSQTAMGFFNIPSGSTGDADTANTSARGNDPLVIVGNGISNTHRSDAFTIANAGYSSNYDNILKGTQITGTPTRMGTNYGSNTIEAWGNVLADSASTFDDIGVFKVIHTTGTGIYTIQLNVLNQNGTPHAFTAGDASIVASIGQGLSGVPGLITVSPLSTSFPGSPTQPIFIVTTFNSSGTQSNTFGFQFHVVAR
jgi:hypothetical protein